MHHGFWSLDAKVDECIMVFGHWMPKLTNVSCFFIMPLYLYSTYTYDLYLYLTYTDTSDCLPHAEGRRIAGRSLCTSKCPNSQLHLGARNCRSLVAFLQARQLHVGLGSSELQVAARNCRSTKAVGMPYALVSEHSCDRCRCLQKTQCEHRERVFSEDFSRISSISVVKVAFFTDVSKISFISAVTRCFSLCLKQLFSREVSQHFTQEFTQSQTFVAILAQAPRVSCSSPSSAKQLGNVAKMPELPMGDLPRRSVQQHRLPEF